MEEREEIGRWRNHGRIIMTERQTLGYAMRKRCDLENYRARQLMPVHGLPKIWLAFNVPDRILSYWFPFLKERFCREPF